jgi:hypothetical protein
MFADYSLKDGKVMDAIEWLLASIKNERRNHSHSSPPLFPFTGQLNIITNTVIHPISSLSATPISLRNGRTLHDPPWFFEEEEAVDMPYSTDTVGRVRGYGCAEEGV